MVSLEFNSLLLGTLKKSVSGIDVPIAKRLNLVEDISHTTESTEKLVNFTNLKNFNPKEQDKEQDTNAFNELASISLNNVEKEYSFGDVPELPTKLIKCHCTFGPLCQEDVCETDGYCYSLFNIDRSSGVPKEHR